MQEFLLKLKATDPDDFAAVAAGLEKLRYWQYHREPLSKAVGDGLFELRHARAVVLQERPPPHRCSRRPQ